MVLSYNIRYFNCTGETDGLGVSKKNQQLTPQCVIVIVKTFGN